jgi:hypothetical protein
MNQRRRANAIAPIALSMLLGCASAPPPAPRPPPEEEAFVLDSKDPNVAPQTNGKSHKKKGKSSASDNASPTHEIGSSYSSSPDHFGRAKLGASRASFRGQGLVGLEDGRTSVTSGDSTYRGIPLDVTYQFRSDTLVRVYFSLHDGSDCKRFLSALEREYGTHVSADQQYTTSTPTYWWSDATGVLRFQIDPESCSGDLSPRRQSYSDER